MKTVRKKGKLEKRDRVLLAARKCFVRHGFHASGMDEISRACGMSVGNLYRYFPRKAAIVQAITDETRLRVAPVLERLARHENPVEGIVQIILFSVKEFCRGSDARLWIEISAEASRNRAVRTLWVNGDREMRGLLKQLLQRAVQAGQASASLDLEAGSIWLMALVDGAITRVSLEPGRDISPTLDTLAGSIRRCLRVREA